MTRSNVFFLTLFALVVSQLPIIQPNIAFSQEKLNRGRTIWSAFECSIFAEISGKPEEQVRLFKLGYETGKEFMHDLKNDKITQNEYGEIPIGIRFVLAGPSEEFVLGRIYETVAGDASEAVTKRNNQGIWVADPSKWVTDAELKKSIAGSKYAKNNCELIK